MKQATQILQKVINMTTWVLSCSAFCFKMCIFSFSCHEQVDRISPPVAKIMLIVLRHMQIRCSGNNGDKDPTPQPVIQINLNTFCISINLTQLWVGVLKILWSTPLITSVWPSWKSFSSWNGPTVWKLYEPPAHGVQQLFTCCLIQSPDTCHCN